MSNNWNSSVVFEVLNTLTALQAFSVPLIKIQKVSKP